MICRELRKVEGLKTIKNFIAEDNVNKELEVI